MLPCRVLVLISDEDRRRSGTSNYATYEIKKTTCTIIHKTYSIQNILFIVKFLSIILLVKKVLILLLVW